MVILFVSLWYFAWGFGLLGFGALMLSALDCAGDRKLVASLGDVKIAIAGIAGFCAITILGAVLNIFIPLNSAIALVMLGTGLLLCVFLRKRILSDLNRSDWIILLALGIYCAVFPLMKCLNFDTDLYHIHAIKWTVECPVPLGLANLHGRFGFNSFWFIAAAILEPARAVVKAPFFIINAIMLFYYGSAVFLTLKNQTANFRSLSSLFLAVTGIPWLIELDYEFASPAPDIPVMLIGFLVFFMLIRYFERENENGGMLLVAVLFSSYIVTLKLSGAALFAGTGLVMVFFFIDRLRKTGSHSFSNRDCIVIMTIASLLIILWVIKSVMVSGCIGYPAAIGLIESLQWSVSAEGARLEAAWVRSWARAPFMPVNEALVNWNWFSPWLKTFLRREALLVPFVLAGIGLFIAGRVGRNKQMLDRAFWAPLAIATSGVICWFLSAPDSRFGYAYLFPFAFILCCRGVINIDLGKRIALGLANNRSLRLSIVLMAIMTLLAGILQYVLSFDLQAVDRLAAAFGRNNLNHDLWIPRLRSYSVFMILLGVLAVSIVKLRICLGDAHSRSRFMVISIVIGLLVLCANTVMINYRDIVTADKYALYEYSSQRTHDGVAIYKMKGQTASGDAPLPSTPYFNPNLKIEFSSSGRPVMFWLK
jgi:hypothetical protein